MHTQCSYTHVCIPLSVQVVSIFLLVLGPTFAHGKIELKSCFFIFKFFPALFAPTPFKGCVGIVFTHGIRLDRWEGSRVVEK